MPSASIKQPSSTPSAASLIRERIKQKGEGYWRVSDFAELPPAAVTQALSRLSREQVLQRVGKGLYYHSRPTTFGPSRPAQSDVLSHRLKMPILPAGLTAANLLGFTTQNPAQQEYATPTNAVAPQTIGDKHVRIITRRPESWKGLSIEDAALLDFLRGRGKTSDLSDSAIQQRLIALFHEPGRFHRLADVAQTEPPRVRAMLGAIGQEIKADTTILGSLKASLNPLSRFDFGALSGLKHAKEWQAK